jgi:glyoxylase-like metal-dependent hydrolase (beta-lactamase superfamily II)
MPDLTPGVASALSPLVRRIVADDAGPAGGPGTNTYLVGIDEVAVIDPGPDDPAHIEAIIGASMRERVRWVLVTHTHPRHLPAARRLADATGAEILVHPVKGVDVAGHGALAHGQVIEGTEFGLEVFRTPGPESTHVSFFLEEERAFFTGDLVVDITVDDALEHEVVVPPPIVLPDGDAAAHLASLELIKKTPRLTRLYPGRGDVIEAPKVAIQAYIDDRLARERQLLDVLEEGPAKVPQIVERVHAGLPDELAEQARRSVLSLLVKLKGEGRVIGRDDRSAWKIA